MFAQLIEKERCIFHDGFESWQDAITASCQPLIADGTIEPSYVDSIIKNVNEFGPYIVIAPDVCIPHAQEGEGVHDTAISFMKTKEPVNFSDNPDESARLFFVLASVNNDIHLENLQALVQILADESNMDILLNAKNIEDLKRLP